MSKKRRWFSKNLWGDAVDTSKMSNSIAKHEKKLDELGIELLPEDEDYGYSSYNWDLDKKFDSNHYQETGNKSEDRKNKYSMVKSEYDHSYNDYEKTGVWRGYSYYQQPQLTYKYVQQMANMLSAKHNVKVVVGNSWQVDLINKTLTYNPASLIYGTKAELLSTLMHEIGKIRYVTHSSLLTNKYLKMYGLPAQEVLSIYEDLRTDYLMLKAYAGASEIYESVIPAVEKQVSDYMKQGKKLRELTVQVPSQYLKNIITDHTYATSDHNVHPEDPNLQDRLLKTFGISDLAKVEDKIKEIAEEVSKKGTVYEYCGEMLSLMYDLDEQRHKKFDNVQEKVDQTVGTIEVSKKAVDSQNLVDFLDNEVYPIIEDLLKDTKDKSDAINKAFPKMPKGIAEAMAYSIASNMQNANVSSNIDKKGNIKIRAGKGLERNKDNTIPPEWEKGDYKVLKDSVDMEIKQLVNRLTFLRREELTVRYQGDQRRGRLNSKKLYKASTGSRRLFKQRLENKDTIQSFAFSILVDVSGSMNGARITHATRGLIILSEVFKKLDIPFEITTFSYGATNIKPFSSDMTKDMEKSIGGLVNSSGGGTNLDNGLEALEIQKQPEKNKIVVVLSDGDVGDPKGFDNEFFLPWKKKGIKSTAFGIECGNAVAKLCMGNSKAIDNASQLPVEFSNLLKGLIKR